MVDKEAAIEAGAVAWFDRVQSQRLDPGAKDQCGRPWTWLSVSEADRRAYRALVSPVVLAALGATMEAAK